MTQDPLARYETWAFALRLLLNYPAFKPVANTLAFATGGPKDMFEAMHVASLAEEMNRDMLYLSFVEGVAAPIAFSLALREAASVTWYGSCTPYADDDTRPLAILTDDRAYQLDERNMLVSRRLPPAGKRRPGAARALKRLERSVAEMEPPLLDGGVFVPAGRPLSEGLPRETLRVVA